MPAMLTSTVKGDPTDTVVAEGCSEMVAAEAAPKHASVQVTRVATVFIPDSYWHRVPTGSFWETKERSRISITPSPLTSTIVSKSALPAFAPSFSLIAETSAQSTFPSPFTSPGTCEQID